METDSNNNNNNNSDYVTVGAESVNSSLNLTSTTSGLPPSGFSVSGGRTNSSSSFSTNNHNLLESANILEGNNMEAESTTTDSSNTDDLLAGLIQNSTAVATSGNKRMRKEDVSENADTNDIMAMLKNASGGAASTMSLNYSEVMYLILRKHFPPTHARDVSKVLMNADATFVADIIRAKTIARGENFVDIRNEVMNSPYDIFANLRTRVSSTMRGQIRNYKDLVKDFASRAAFCDISLGGVVTCNGRVLFQRTDYAYNYANVRLDNYSDVFNLDTSNFTDDREVFFFLLFCTSNGHFIFENGRVTYMLNDLDAGDNVIFSRFIIPSEIRMLRVGFAKIINKKLQDFQSHELSYTFLSKLYIPQIKVFQDNINKAMCSFYDFKKIISGNERTILQNLNSFSQNNKAWRKQKDISWFVPTPEFDYWDKNLNLYPKHSRNEFIGIKGASKQGPINTNGVYDLTGVDPTQIVINGPPKGMFLRYAIDDKWTRLFNTKFNVTYTYAQLHSMLVMIRPAQGDIVKVEGALKEWYSIGFRVFRGEVAYMINMLTGRFPMSGLSSVARVASVKLGTRASKIAEYF